MVCGEMRSVCRIYLGTGLWFIQSVSKTITFFLPWRRSDRYKSKKNDQADLKQIQNRFKTDLKQLRINQEGNQLKQLAARRRPGQNTMANLSFLMF